MSYKDPTILSLTNPTGLDYAIETIRANLAQLPWLEKSFGRAWEFKEKRSDGRTIKIPKAFIGQTDAKEGEYLNVLPNDNLNAQSFIVCSGPEEWEQFNRYEGSMKKRRLSVIIWVNLKAIDITKNYIFTDELKDQVQAILSRLPVTFSMNEYTDEKAEDVFTGFDLDDVDTQYLMYPYAGMRFDLTVIYPDVCNGSQTIVIIPVSTGKELEIAEIGQSSTSAPTGSISKNDFGVTPTWGRTSAGVYTLTMAGKFTLGKTIAFFTNGNSGQFVAARTGDLNIIILFASGDNRIIGGSLKVIVRS